MINDTYSFLNGAEKILPKNQVLERLSNGPCRIKWGADPSAKDLHFGHLVLLLKLRELQKCGHVIQFVIGSFTAQIGDPTGKSKTRPPLTQEEVLLNAESYQEQVFSILDKQQTEIHYNHEWLDRMGAKDMIQICSQSTVARMLERDDFSKRYQGEVSIGIHEFLYPLMQGYDSVVLRSDIEVGGSDQEFNLLMGRQLQRHAGQKEQGVLTFPILEGLDGFDKMSKSLGNHIALKDSPNEIYGKLMSIPDSIMLRYFELLTDRSVSEIAELKKRLDDGENPKYLKQLLAYELVSLVYDEPSAQKAKDGFEAVFSHNAVPENIPETRVEKALTLLDCLAQSELAFSKKELRRLFQQGAIKVCSEVVKDPFYVLDSEGETIVKIGKRHFLKVIVQ